MSITFKYVDYITSEFYYKELDVLDVSEIIKNALINVQVGGYYIEDEEKLFQGIKISYSTEEESETLFNVEARHIFSLSGDMEKYISDSKEEKVFDIDYGLKVTFASVLYSTMRGVLREKLSGTRYKDVILPIINPEGLIDKDSKILAFKNFEELETRSSL